MKIKINTIVVRNPEQEFTTIDDEIVMMNKKTGEYNALNAVASRIWQIIGMPIAVSDLVKMLTNEFEIDVETCENQTILLLNGLLEKSLINIQG